MIGYQSEDSTLSITSDLEEKEDVVTEKSNFDSIIKTHQSFEIFHQYVGEYKMNYNNKVIIENSKTTINLLNIISVDFKSIFRSSESSEMVSINDCLKYLEERKEKLKMVNFVHQKNLYVKVMTIKFYDIFQNAIIQLENNIIGAYDCTTIMFKSRYPTADYPSLEKVSNCWINQVFMRELKSNKTNMKNIKDVYNETCDDFKYVVPIFQS